MVFFESMGAALSKHSLIFSLPVKESDSDLLISYVNQSLMIASNVINELDGFSFGINAPKGLQPKGCKSILLPISGLKGMGCCMFNEKDLVCFDDSHPPNSPKR